MIIKKPLFKLLSLFGIALFTLSACGSLKTEAPEAVLKKFQGTVKEINSMDMTLAAVMKGQDEKDKIDFNLGADIKIDRRPSEDPKADFSLTLDGSLVAEEKNINGKGALDIRTIGKEFYFNLKEFESNDPNTDPLKTVLTPYLNKWLSLASDFVPPSLVEFQDKSEETIKKEEQLKELFANANLFEVTKEFGAETVNGQEVYHYGVKLNKEGVKDYIQKANRINGTEMTPEEAEESAQFADSVTNLELWIGTDDYYLYKGLVNFSGKDEEGAAKTTIDLTYNAKSYNKDMQIAKPEKPEEFNPLTLLMSLQMGQVGAEEETLPSDAAAEEEKTDGGEEADTTETAPSEEQPGE